MNKNDKRSVRMEYHNIIFGSFRENIFQLNADIITTTNELKKVLENDSDNLDKILEIANELSNYKKEREVFQTLLYNLETTSADLRSAVDDLNGEYDIKRIHELNATDHINIFREVVLKRIVDNLDNK